MAEELKNTELANTSSALQIKVWLVTLQIL